PEIAVAYSVDVELTKVPTRYIDWNEWVGRHPVWVHPPCAPRTSMFYTSGTTGHPKGVRRAPPTNEMQRRIAEMPEMIFGIGPEIDLRTVITGPLYHSAPNFYAMSAVRERGFVVLQPRFSPVGLLDLVDRYKITHLHMVPIMFVRLLRLPDEIKIK